MYEPCNEDMMISIPLSQWREIQKKLYPEQVLMDMEGLMDKRAVLLDIKRQLLPYPAPNEDYPLKQNLVLTYTQALYLKMCIMNELVKIDEYRTNVVD